MIEDLVACYFRFIKDKAEIYSRSKFSLNVAKDKRKMYFKVMNADDILAENRDLAFLTSSAFEVNCFVRNFSVLNVLNRSSTLAPMVISNILLTNMSSYWF